MADDAVTLLYWKIAHYTNYLKKFINQEMELIIEHKADYKYTLVGASSIIAKVEREKEVEEIEKKIGQKIGSGYMSNPQCQKFTKENWEKHPDLFRKSWMPYKKLISGKSQKKLNDY